MSDERSASNTGQLNGYHAAPPPASGGALYSARPQSASVPQQTVFPPDLGEYNLRSVFYWLGWAEMGGHRLRRWVVVAAVLLSILLLLLRTPGIAWIVLIFGVLLALVYLLPSFYRRTGFVRFVAESAPARLDAERLPPANKVAVHVSGVLTVAGKRRSFLWLPAYYRTFATREHALLCLCRDRRILGIGAPPEADVGLWYAFWHGNQIVELTQGEVGTGRRTHPGIRLIYQPADKKGRFGVAPTPDTLYIACSSVEERDRIVRDLQVESDAESHASRPQVAEKQVISA